jgi:hypothetical protein
MPSQNEVSLLRDQITEEVNRDAEVIGNQLFSAAVDKREPDITHVSDELLRTLYRQKVLDGDREWLGNEAQRDPQQFMRVAEAIGLVHPDRLEQNGLQAAPPSLPAGPPPAIAPINLAAAPPPVPPLAAAPPAPVPAPPPSLVPQTQTVPPALVQAAIQQAMLQQQNAPPVPAPMPPGTPF